MSANQYYAYIDESGNFDVKNNDNMLVISAIVTSDPIVLARSMRTAEKKVRNSNKKGSSELKAAYQKSATRKKVLNQLIKADLSIYSIIFDLKSLSNIPYSFDAIYKVGMSMLCSVIYGNHNNDVAFILDKRYTKESLRDQLSQNIRELIWDNYGNNEEITIYHSDSKESKTPSYKSP